ncbi:MAG: hypothetical protein AB7N76_13020 [Planctomycetota bacterium]
MDLDAEMAELAREARRQLEAREREERALGADAPQTGADLELPELPRLDAGLAAGLDAEAAAPLPLATKVGLGLLGLAAFALLWRTLLAPLVQGALSLALLALILVAIWRLLRGRPAAQSPDDA